MAGFSFSTYEEKNKHIPNYKGQAIDHLRSVGKITNISWEDIDAQNLTKEQQFDYLKANEKNITFDVNNATKENIHGKEWLEQDYKKKLSDYNAKYGKSGYFDKVGDEIALSAQGIVSGFGYESDSIKELINDTKQLTESAKLARKDITESKDYERIKDFLHIGLNAQENFLGQVDNLFSLRADKKNLQERANSSDSSFWGKIDKKIAQDLLDSNAHLSQEELAIKKEAEAFKLYEDMQKAKNQGKELVLDEKQRSIINETIGITGRIFRDTKEQEQYFFDLNRARELSSDFVKKARKLENVLVDKQFFGLLSNAETYDEKQQEEINNFTSLAENLGFDCVAWNKDGLYFIKDERAYKVEQNFMQELESVLKDNIGSISLGLAGAAYGATKGKSAKAKFANMVGYGAAGAFGGGALDSILTDVFLEREIDIAQALTHGAQEGSLALAADVALKGVSTTFKMIKGGIVQTDKGLSFLQKGGQGLKEVFNSKNISAISRMQKTQVKKDEMPQILKAFQQSQSENLIRKDFQEQTITQKIMDKLKPYVPKALKTTQDSLTTQKRQELLALSLRNKDLADSLAGQLDDVEARILSQASNKMAKDFKNLSQSYEKLIAKEILKDEANPSLPKVFQKAIEVAESNVKAQYAKSVGQLESVLKDQNIDLLTPFKNIADYAIREYGANSEISRALINEVKSLEGRNITIKEALEKRKDVNEIIRNYNDNPNALKKFRISSNATDLKQAIDIQIHNAIETGIAKGRIDQNARQALASFKEANTAYADIKTRLNDKLTKAIFMNQPKKSTINSMRSVEEWKKAVLDKQWADSITGLENTIFAKFDPRMQEATQTLLIFRALERHIKEKEGASFIDLSKALKDIKELETLPLHPEAQKALNIFKELAQTYEFINKLSGAKGFKSGAGSGALSTTLEGRAKVFLANNLFKKLFFRVPFVGDKDALLFHLRKAVQDLKYPRAITLDMLTSPAALKPNPKSPLNPKGEAFIDSHTAASIEKFSQNPSVLNDELSARLSEYNAKNPINAPSANELLHAIESQNLIFSKVGAGKLTDEMLGEIKGILKSGESESAASSARAYTQIQNKADFIKNLDLSKSAQTLPKELNVDEFLNTLQNVKNKENFIEHLKSKKDAQSRLAYLNIVEPTLTKADIELTFANKKEYIKAFKNANGKNIFNLLVSKENDTLLITMIPNAEMRYIKSEINKADIIHSFIPQDSKATKASGLSSADSTTTFAQSQIKFDTFEDFAHFTRLTGIEAGGDSAKLKEAYEYIKQNLHKVEC